MVSDKSNVLIIGAGPAGLATAYMLVKNGVKSTVFEQDPTYVGGISRTVEYKGNRFDIGGHRFFSKSDAVTEFWRDVLGPELIERNRISRIYFKKKFFDYPIRPLNAFRNLGPISSSLCVLDYARIKLFPRRNVVSFEDWVVNNFGERLFATFFKSYTEKVWGMPCNQISADWAAQRIKGLSMLSLLRSMFTLRRSGQSKQKVIKTLIDRFLYPRFGPGQMWERVTEILREAGVTVEMDADVKQVHWGNGGCKALVVEHAGGRKETLQGTHFVSSMPVRTFVNALVPPAPKEIIEAANRLRYRDFVVVALVIDQNNLFEDNWIYVHDPEVRVGRIQNFGNWSPDMVQDPATSCLGMEYFCFKNDGLWNMTDQELLALATAELKTLGLSGSAKVLDGAVVRVPKAYPVYDDNYQASLDVVRGFIQDKLPNLQFVGRNGMHRYNNQDHAIMTGFLAAQNIMVGKQEFDLWRVNQDAIYVEEGDASDLGEGGRLYPTRLSE